MRSISKRALLASLLVVAHLLAPFAHGPSVAVTPGWTDVCTGDGLRRIATDDGPVASLHDGDHCALCRIASLMAGVAPAVPALDGPRAVRALPAPAEAWLAGRPPRHDDLARAPPLPC